LATQQCGAKATNSLHGRLTGQLLTGRFTPTEIQKYMGLHGQAASERVA